MMDKYTKSGCHLLMVGLLTVLTACNSGNGSGGSEDPDINIGPGAGSGILPEMTVHDTAFKDDHYSGSGQCNICHNEIHDEADNEIGIGKDWAPSMMANATRDPYWIAKVAAEIDRHPELKGELDETCSRCHAPMAFDAAEKDGVEYEIHGENGILEPSNPYFDHAMEGVSCTLCHQMEDNGKLGTMDGVSGKFSVAEHENANDRPAYGQYEAPSGSYMLSTAQFNPVYSGHISTSESCATCHDLRTPSVDGGGHVITTSEEQFFPEQMVFSEWENSDFAVGGSKEQTCQSCHMPKAVGEVMLASDGGGLPRTNFSRHTFLGANTVMQTLLKNYSKELGIELEPEIFDRSIALNQDFLKTAGSIALSDVALVGGQLKATVKVNNTTGHKLPSGYPSRRVFIHFVVTNDAGEVVFESGKVNSNGSIAGVATDFNSAAYEPHYETITAEDQVQVYEAIMGNSDSAVTHTLLRATHYLKENRLLPSGFNKLGASDDVKVSGAAFDDTNFQAASDTLNYNVTVPAAGTYNVLVELKYQPLAYGHLQDLFKSVKVKEVDEFKTMFDATTHKTETIASAITEVE